MTLNVWEHPRFPSSENSTFSAGEICALVQEVLLKALTLIGCNGSEFQGD